jgi:hypothetical protein
MQTTQIYFLKHESGYAMFLREAVVYARCKDEGKSIPLQSLTRTEVSRRLRFPDFKTIGT